MGGAMAIKLVKAFKVTEEEPAVALERSVMSGLQGEKFAAGDTRQGRQALAP
jgi:hypothetical protein